MTEVLHLVRLTIEAETPLSIGSGDLIDKSDTTSLLDADALPIERNKEDEGLPPEALVRDANGLPIIPGSTLQGVLRHLWTVGNDNSMENALFGFADKDDKGQTGRVFFGFGLPHDSKNKAMTGRLMPVDIQTDPVLAFLANAVPLLRHHVKLDHRSVALDKHKFDRCAVPIGTRFSFELAMWGKFEEQEKDSGELGKLVSLVKHPAFRLGGAGRHGYGKVKLVCHSYKSFDKPADIRKHRKQPPSASLPDALTLPEIQCDAVTAIVTLKPIGPWRISWHTEGAGERGEKAMTLDTYGIRFANGQPYDVGENNNRPNRRGEQRNNEQQNSRVKNKETLPVREPLIAWKPPANGDGETASLEKPKAEGPFRFSIPGSAIRGPLAHRALFHWNTASGNVIDADDPPNEDDLEKWQNRPPEFHTLFGWAKERKDAAKEDQGQVAAISVEDENRGLNRHIEEDKGQASALFVEDGKAEDVKAVQAIPHSSIDRFTGGVRSGVLYTEEVAIGGKITLNLLVTKPNEIEPKVRTAFLKALRDLVAGRLAFGAKSHGFATGEVKWLDKCWQEAWEELP